MYYLWNVTTKVAPSIIEATGTLSKSLRQYLSNIPGKHDVISRNYTKQPHWALHRYCGSTDVQYCTQHSK
jgi:hypothetical protein